MLKKIILSLLLLITFLGYSQNTIKGKLNPQTDTYSWVILYQLKGAKQLYITNSVIENSQFTLEMPEKSEQGMYRLVYSMDNGKNIDFIYKNNSVEITFNPENPLENISFINSENNSKYYNYLAKSSLIKQKLDSLQLTYFKLIDEKERLTTENLYKEGLNSYQQIEQSIVLNSTDTLFNNILKMKKKYYAPQLFSSAQEYLNSEKMHFFDSFNFSTEELETSTLLAEKIVDYIFYLNVSDDVEVQNKLYKNAVNEVMQKIGDNNEVKSEILSTVLYTFSQLENVELTNFLVDKYNSLPEKYINKSLVEEVESLIKLAIGKTAPDFSWKEKSKEIKLSELDVAEKYILVFWSTSCSHCLEEVPKLYDYTKDKENIHVIAVALEKDELGFNHYTLNYVKWTNVLGLKKWENSIAKEYKISATPTYFVLDKDKKIIAKPDYFEDVKAFFEN